MGCGPSSPRAGASGPLASAPDPGILLLDVALQLPAPIRAPLDEYAAAGAASALRASLALADGLERARAEVAPLASDPGGAHGADALWGFIDTLLGKFGALPAPPPGAHAHGGERLVLMRSAFLRQLDALGRDVWIKLGAALDYTIACKHLAAARAVLLGLLAMAALPRFLDSPGFAQLVERLGGSHAALPVASSVWDWSCSGSYLAQALLALRAATPPPQPPLAFSNARDWKRATGRLRREWLDKLKPVLESLPCMASVSDMKNRGACVRCCRPPPPTRTHTPRPCPPCSREPNAPPPPSPSPAPFNTHAPLQARSWCTSTAALSRSLGTRRRRWWG